MKQASLLYLFIIFLSLPVLTACDDDDDNSPSKTELLTSKTWQGEAVFASGINITDNPELLNSIPDVRTLTLDFETDGTYTANYKEDGVDIKQDGDWEFRDNETVLHFDLMADYKLTIGELSAERLTLTTMVNYQGFAVPAEVRFVSQ